MTAHQIKMMGLKIEILSSLLRSDQAIGEAVPKEMISRFDKSDSMKTALARLLKEGMVEEVEIIGAWTGRPRSGFKITATGKAWMKPAALQHKELMKGIL